MLANVSGAESVQLVVGLGNPGVGHAEDRHNVGFWLVDALANKLKVELRVESRYTGELGRAASGLRLLKPATFMNRSGDAVAPCATYFRIPPPAVLVVHDELDLPVGTVRLKRGGGHGGHNGLRSIEQMLGSSIICAFASASVIRVSDAMSQAMCYHVRRPPNARPSRPPSAPCWTTSKPSSMVISTAP